MFSSDFSKGGDKVFGGIIGLGFFVLWLAAKPNPIEYNPPATTTLKIPGDLS